MNALDRGRKKPPKTRKPKKAKRPKKSKLTSHRASLLVAFAACLWIVGCASLELESAHSDGTTSKAIGRSFLAKLDAEMFRSHYREKSLVDGVPLEIDMGTVGEGLHQDSTEALAQAFQLFGIFIRAMAQAQAAGAFPPGMIPGPIPQPIPPP